MDDGQALAWVAQAAVKYQYAGIGGGRKQTWIALRRSIRPCHQGLCITALAEDDVETALDALEMAADERSLILLWIRVTPITAKLLGEHPRFTAINRSIWPDDYPEDVATGA